MTLELTAKAMDCPYDIDYACSLVGTPLIKMGEDLCGEQRAEEFLNTYVDLNYRYAAEMISLYDGMGTVLEDIKQHDIPMGIVTAKRLVALKRNLDYLELNPYFSVLCTKESTAKFKPEPDPVLFAVKELNIEPRDAVMIGDTHYDLLSGKRAGAVTIGVTWGIDSREALKELSNPDYIVDTPMELLACIKQLY